MFIFVSCTFSVHLFFDYKIKFQIVTFGYNLIYAMCSCCFDSQQFIHQKSRQEYGHTHQTCLLKSGRGKKKSHALTTPLKTLSDHAWVLPLFLMPVPGMKSLILDFNCLFYNGMKVEEFKESSPIAYQNVRSRTIYSYSTG